MEVEKAKFQDYACNIISKYSDTQHVQLVLREQMNDFLGSADFVYRRAIKDFERCVTVAEGVSPSPQSSTQTPISRSRYTLHSNPQQTPPSKIQLVEYFAPTPSQENFDSGNAQQAK